MSKKKQKPVKEAILFPQTALFLEMTSPGLQQRVNDSFKEKPLTRDEEVTIQSIRKAQTPFMLVGLIEDARGAARYEWLARMEQFGLAGIPALQRGLRTSQSRYEVEELNYVVNLYITAFVRMGINCGEALLACFNSLDDYGQSLACVAFGMLRTQQAVDTVWRFYQRVKDSDDVGLVIGALFGLVYLSHPQRDEALAETLIEQESCRELYLLAALAGGRACAWSLVIRLVNTDITSETFDGERLESQIAMSAVAERIGLDEFRVVLKENQAADVSIDILAQLAEQVFGKARILYELFYNAQLPSGESPHMGEQVT